jgi:signal transduction histidine kinase/CheY-like chemotaxis protein
VSQSFASANLNSQTQSLPDLSSSSYSPRSAFLCRRIANTSLVAAIGISLLALVGWMTGMQILASFHPAPNVVPMAPLTSAFFLLTAAAIALHVWGKRQAPRVVPWVVVAIAVFVAGFGTYKLVMFAQGNLGFELALAERAEIEKTTEAVPKGVMSPLTALSFFFSALGTVFLAFPSRTWTKRATALCAMIVVFLNVWVLLRYLESTSRVLQGWWEIPVAISTALGFLSVGLALITIEGPSHILIRPFTGNSARALLLRSFLPATLFVTFFPFLISSVFAPLTGDNSVDLDIRSGFSTGWLIVSGIVTILVISWVSQRIGRRIDQAEAETEQAIEELREARDAAKASDRAKSEFLANMSHELRTPLNSVIGYSEMLREEAEENELHQFIPDLKQIHASGQHLLALINDILDLSKIEAGEMGLRKQTFALDEFLNSVLTSVRPNVERNRNELKLSANGQLGEVTTDPMRLRQCLLNLLSNAGKFTEDGTVTLQVHRESRRDGDWIVFRVIDTGIGMSADQLDLVFQPFKQADTSTTRRYEGTGLGLTISRKLMALLGGSVTAQSQSGEGSTFTLEIPVGAKDAKPAEQEGVSSETNGKAVLKPGPGQNSVMVVDDDPAVRRLLTRFLEKEGFHVVPVARGRDVVEAAKRCRPQAITLDVMMPEVDGWEVISRLKADPETANIPVVILTIIDDKNMGYMLGAADYLTKPFDRQRLLDTLSRYCNVSEEGLALVVEDDAPSRELVRRTLEKDGWAVVEASNGHEAWACMARRAPSLILLDLMMPDIDGFEFLDELRQHPQWRSIPVIVITAKDLTEEDRMYLNGSCSSAAA